MSEVYIAEQALGHCVLCGKWEDLRHGVCFDCATAAEEDSESEN